MNNLRTFKLNSNGLFTVRILRSKLSFVVYFSLAGYSFGISYLTTKRLDYYLSLMLLNQYLDGLKSIVYSLTLYFITLNGYVVIVKLVLIVRLSNRL